MKAKTEPSSVCIVPYNLPCSPRCNPVPLGYEEERFLVIYLLFPTPWLRPVHCSSAPLQDCTRELQGISSGACPDRHQKGLNSSNTPVFHSRFQIVGLLSSALRSSKVNGHGQMLSQGSCLPPHHWTETLTELVCMLPMPSYLHRSVLYLQFVRLNATPIS